jgi:hypothetical protein
LFRLSVLCMSLEQAYYKSWQCHALFVVSGYISYHLTNTHSCQQHVRPMQIFVCFGKTLRSPFKT